MNRAKLISILFLFSIFSLHGQDTTAIRKISDYTKHITSFARAYEQEKVYMHFDNTAYFKDETMWFKAYVVRADRNSLSPISKTLYVELLNEEGNLLETKKLKLEDGRCHGEFLLKDLLYSGYYEIRAYTRHMLNDGSESIFSRVFPISDVPNQKGDYTKSKIRERPYSQRVPGPRMNYLQKEKNTITFYPEGGNLVAGITSRIAFQAFDKDGKNAIVSGVVISDTGDTLSNFNTSHLNMGKFLITPKPGKNNAKVMFNDKSFTFDFPEVKPEGYVMAVDVSDISNLVILIQKTPELPSEPLGLSITCRGKLYGLDSLIIGNENAISMSFPKKMLPSGVSQITLYNESGEVLAERMVFINHNSLMKMEVTSNKPSYNPFEKVTMDFILNDVKDNPLETDFSVSVRDASTTAIDPNGDNILTNLLLSSELKGYIENPGYYFETDDDQRKQDLDLLLMTQGWSRYSWKKMAGVEKLVEKHPFEEGLYLEGRIISLWGKKPKENIEVLMVLMSDSTSQHNICKTDKEGRFYFYLVDFYGKSKLTLQTKAKGRRKEHAITLDRVFSPGVKKYSFYEKLQPVVDSVKTYTVIQTPLKAVEDLQVNTDTLKKEALKPIDKKSHMLKEVVIKGKKQFEMENEGLRDANIVVDVTKKIDEFVDLGDYVPVTLSDFMYETSPYFSIHAGINGTSDYYKGKRIMSVYNNHYLGYGLPDFIMSEVETLMISEKPGVALKYNPGAEGSEVVFFLYGKQNKRKEPYGIRNTTLQGYSLVKEFYSPQYDKIVLPDDKDYRRTLYWNPEVKTNKEGKATISFYNNSSCKKMNVSAETVTGNGVVGALLRTIF